MDTATKNRPDEACSLQIKEMPPDVRYQIRQQVVATPVCSVWIVRLWPHRFF